MSRRHAVGRWSRLWPCVGFVHVGRQVEPQILTGRALRHIVHLGPEGEAAVHRFPQHLGRDAAEHAFEVAQGNPAIQIAPQFAVPVQRQRFKRRLAVAVIEKDRRPHRLQTAARGQGGAVVQVSGDLLRHRALQRQPRHDLQPGRAANPDVGLERVVLIKEPKAVVRCQGPAERRVQVRVAERFRQARPRRRNLRGGTNRRRAVHGKLLRLKVGPPDGDGRQRHAIDHRHDAEGLDARRQHPRHGACRASDGLRRGRDAGVADAQFRRGCVGSEPLDANVILAQQGRKFARHLRRAAAVGHGAGGPPRPAAHPHRQGGTLGRTTAGELAGVQRQMGDDADLGAVHRIGTQTQPFGGLIFDAKVERAFPLERMTQTGLFAIGVAGVFGLEAKLVVDLPFKSGKRRCRSAEPLAGVEIAAEPDDDGWPVAKRRSDAAIGSQPPPAQTGGDLDPRNEVLGGGDVFPRQHAGSGKVLQADGDGGQIAPLFQHLIAQIEAAVVIDVERVDAAAIGRTERLVPVAYSKEPETRRQARCHLKRQRGAADRAEPAGGDRQLPIRLRLARGHVDQAGGTVEVERAGRLGIGAGARDDGKRHQPRLRRAPDPP